MAVERRRKKRKNRYGEVLVEATEGSIPVGKLAIKVALSKTVKARMAGAGKFID